MVFQRSMFNWRSWGQSAMGICQFLYIWNLYGVKIFKRSMFDWRRGWGQSAMGICVLSYIWNLFGVMVFQKSMVDWRREGWGLSALVFWSSIDLLVIGGGGMGGLLLIWGGVGSICHGYMCILLYIGNLFDVMVFQKSMVNWRREGWDLSALVSVHSSIYET